MAAYYSMPMPNVPLYGAGLMAGRPAHEEDDPVPPQFATRYTQNAVVPLLPPFQYMPAVTAPMPLWVESSKCCVAPCCTTCKDGTHYTAPAYMPDNVYAPLQAYVAQPEQQSSPIRQRSWSKDSYKEGWGTFPAPGFYPGHGDHMPYTIPPISADRRSTVDLDAVDHPSYMRPPHLDTQKKPYGVAAAVVSTSTCENAPDSGYCSATASPSLVYNVYQLIPAEPMPAPAPLSIEMSGAQIADAVAGVLYDTHAGRFGAIGAPSPPRGGRKASSAALDGALHVTTRGEFVQFVRTVLAGTRVNCAVVANAVSYLCDARLQKELRARSLQLSFVAALSISHKTLDDSPFTTATWAKLARLELEHLRTAERALCYGLSFEVRPDLNSERFIDATNLLISRLPRDTQGYMLLIAMIENFALAL